MKGIATLLVLKEIFKAVCKEACKEVQPWEIFDLIGGTSTGGYDPIHFSGRVIADAC